MAAEEEKEKEKTPKIDEKKRNRTGRLFFFSSPPNLSLAKKNHSINGVSKCNQSVKTRVGRFEKDGRHSAKTHGNKKLGKTR